MQHLIFYRFIIFLLIISALLVCQSGCDKKSQESVFILDTGTITLMGTFARIQVRCTDKEAGLQGLADAQASLDEVDRLMSTYRSDSELSRVNRQAHQNPVKISPETYHVLKKACYYNELTEGAFDITVSPLLKIWKEASEKNQLPRTEELEQAQKNVGTEKLILSESNTDLTVSFAQGGIELNLNAIAKGYAVDQALARLRRPGIIGALVDIGGEIACFGQNRPGQDWIVGIQDPFATDNTNPLSQHPRWRVRLQDGAIATSGNYRRYVTINGKNYSHIIDPRTAYPAQNIPSVTIIAPYTIDADALATAVSVMGIKEGLKLIESLENTEAFLVTGTNEKPVLYRSKGFSEFEIQ
ncbi:MAG: FAD:protein FMN transferase [Sedimentisphaerales bacterium]|nr:FAD:protein FMN transferase [Sedimentisphaerales bacterium]